MDREAILTKKQEEEIEIYSKYLECSEGIFGKTLYYFLSKEPNTDELIVSRKLFILKLLKEHSDGDDFHLGDIPKEIRDRLINAHSKELEKEEEAKREHINSLLKEMDNLF